MGALIWTLELRRVLREDRETGARGSPKEPLSGSPVFLGPGGRPPVLQGHLEVRVRRALPQEGLHLLDGSLGLTVALLMVGRAVVRGDAILVMEIFEVGSKLGSSVRHDLCWVAPREVQASQGLRDDACGQAGEGNDEWVGGVPADHDEEVAVSLLKQINRELLHRCGCWMVYKQWFRCLARAFYLAQLAGVDHLLDVRPDVRPVVMKLC